MSHIPIFGDVSASLKYIKGSQEEFNLYEKIV
jgi:hypothetical protein